MQWILAGLNAQGIDRASRFFEQITVFETGPVLVLDLQMPEMDGIEVMWRLAQMTDPQVVHHQSNRTFVPHAGYRSQHLALVCAKLCITLFHVLQITTGFIRNMHVLPTKR